MSIDSPAPNTSTEYRRIRIGLVVVDNDPIPELEINKLAPPGVSIHVTRFRLPRKAGEEFTGEAENSSQIGPHLLEPLETLARIGVDAVGLCFTSSSIFNPSQFDDAFIAAAQNINPLWKVATAARAIVATMKRAGAARPHVLIPPWFTHPTIQAMDSYLALNGIVAAGSHQHELLPSWNRYPRQDRFDRGAKWAVCPHEVIRDLHTKNLSSADSILVPGSGFPSLDILHENADAPPLPMFTANRSVLDELVHQMRLEEGAT